MGKYVIDEATLTDIGDAIREKEGTTAAIPVSDMKGRILAIKSGGNEEYETVVITVDATSGVLLEYFCGCFVADGALEIMRKEELGNCSFEVIKNSPFYAGNAIKSHGMVPAMSVFCDGNLGGIAYEDITLTTKEPCFVEGTAIAMADGIEKQVQEITHSDLLLVWDFDNGCCSSAKPIWIKKTQKTKGYYLCKFANGIELKLVGSDGSCHRVFSMDDNKFVYATECVGKMIYTEKGVTKLISCEYIEEPVNFYNIITERHLNLFAEGVLTSCRLNNMYPVEDMKYVKDNRNIVPISAYPGVCEKFYDGLRLGEQGAENINATNKYVHRLYALMK